MWNVLEKVLGESEWVLRDDRRVSVNLPVVESRGSVPPTVWARGASENGRSGEAMAKKQRTFLASTATSDASSTGASDDRPVGTSRDLNTSSQQRSYSYSTINQKGEFSRTAMTAPTVGPGVDPSFRTDHSGTSPSLYNPILFGDEGEMMSSNRSPEEDAYGHGMDGIDSLRESYPTNGDGLLFANGKRNVPNEEVP